MSSFDSFSDAAFQLKTEGENITLSFKKGVPSNSQGTVSWNIPAPAQGCTSLTSAYSGMVVLLGKQAMQAENIPQDDTVYVADPTANFDAHVGDRIGNALVVGAFYECEKKNRGEDLTVEFVVNDLQPNTAYYVAGYATDCQHRYHSDGTRAYSDSYGEKSDPNKSAQQVIQVGNPNNSTCIKLSDGTKLIPGVDYQFDVIVDNAFPTGADMRTLNITIPGLSVGTYQQLLDEINSQLKIADNPDQSPVPPNTGHYYWDVVNQKLYIFDGTTYNKQDTLVEGYDPSIISDGSYWYNPENNVLQLWNTIGSPGSWSNVPIIETSYDPTNPPCDAYWYDQLLMRQWDGTTWIDLPTVISDTDPAACSIIECGSYWYDETTNILKEWEAEGAYWLTREARYWPTSPTELINGTFWIDPTTNVVNIRVGTMWVIMPNVMVEDKQPVGILNGTMWYNSTTEELKQYNSYENSWTLIASFIWEGDPTIIQSGDLWWNSSTDTLYVWDALNLGWDEVNNFVISSTDPMNSITIVAGTIWYNLQNNTMNSWDGVVWENISEYIQSLTDPTDSGSPAGLLPGAIWKDDTKWYIRDIFDAWIEFNPIDSITDPSLIANGVYWYNTINDMLTIRNGISWVSVSYSTLPALPARGAQWFDTSTDMLMEWDGSGWVETQSSVYASFNGCGFTFTTKATGSNNVVIVPAPSGSSQYGCDYGTGYADFENYGAVCNYSSMTGTQGYPARDIPLNSYLWTNITPSAILQAPVEGSDGKHNTPSYDTIGVGDDGTPDERRELADSIRQQLGYPVVEVELTKYQIDTAIQGALESFRKRSSSAYRRGFYFMDIKPQQQHYEMTNRTIGYDKIVNISAVYRFTSAFMSTAHGGGVYGQIVLQHLYNMGTYDLTSYFLVAQYIETMQDLFATRLVFSWHENSRMLGFHQIFTRPERVLIDCTIERTEQDLFKDRLAKSWLERYALAESMIVLAQIRGKYASLPGAGGGISLNASDLMATADTYRQELIQQLDDFIVQEPEDVGIGSTFILG